MVIKTLKTIGSLVLSLVISYILWLIFYFATPHIMKIGWVLFALYILFAGGLITTIM